MGDRNRDPHPDSPPEANSRESGDMERAATGTEGDIDDARLVIPADTSASGKTGEAGDENEGIGDLSPPADQR